MLYLIHFGSTRGVSKLDMETVTTAPQTTHSAIVFGQSVQAIKKHNPKAKHWAGCTMPNPTDADFKAIEAIKPLVDYFVFGKEIGAGGLAHLQFMVCFKTQRTLTAVKKLFPTQAHWEVKSSRSTMKRSSDYCKKGDQSKDEWEEWHEAGIHFGQNADFIEYGTLPLDQKTAGLKVIADNYADTIAKAKTGNIEDILPEHQLKYYGTIKKMQADHKKMPENLTWKDNEPPNLWIHGKTGTGKSRHAREYFKHEFYPKIASNKWWDKYKGEDNVLIEDMDLTHQYQGYYLKIWADRYAFPVEVKNGHDYIRPKVIIVTSNYKIEEVFPDPSIHEPLKRRFKVIEKQALKVTIKPRSKAAAGPIKEKKQPALKKRKFDQPLKKPALYRQDANGEIVKNNSKQSVIEETPLFSKIGRPVNQAALDDMEEIQKEKEVI